MMVAYTMSATTTTTTTTTRMKGANAQRIGGFARGTSVRSGVPALMRRRDAVCVRAGVDLNATIISPIKSTISDVQTVSGAKNVAERIALFAPVAIPGLATICAWHFGGAGIGAMMAAAKMPAAPITMLAPLTGVLLMSKVGVYVQALATAAGALGIGEDAPAAYATLIYFLACFTLWAGSGLGLTDAFVRSAMAYHAACGSLVALRVKGIREQMSAVQAEALRKVALAGPTVMMSCLILQGASLASFNAAGLAGPGILGPIAALLFQPITHYLSIFAGFNYWLGVETKRSSAFLALVNLIAGISLTTQLAYPYCYMLCSMHLACAFGLLRESTPSDSFIPNLA
jgi:hypothetical protein